MAQTQETENKNVEKRLLEEIKKLGHEKELLQKKIKVIETTPPKSDLVKVINQLTQEIESKEEKILNHESIMYARDKEEKLLKQTIKDISKKYSDSENMYEQVCASMEKCLADNEKLKLDLIQKKKLVVVDYKLFGFCVFSKISS